MGFGRPVLDSDPAGRIITWDDASAYLRGNEVPDTVKLHSDDDDQVIIGVEVDAERVIFLSGRPGEEPLTLAGLREALAAAGARGHLRLTIWYLGEVYRIVDLGYFYDDDGVISDFQFQRRWG